MVFRFKLGDLLPTHSFPEFVGDGQHPSITRVQLPAKHSSISISLC